MKFGINPVYILVFGSFRVSLVCQISLAYATRIAASQSSKIIIMYNDYWYKAMNKN